MVPADDGPTGDRDSGRPSYVHCAECGAKASPDWTFCRSCEASLDDAETVDETLVVRTDGEDVDLSAFVGEETGCEKCGHTDAEVADVAVTSLGFAWALDTPDRRLRAVSCTRCGYTEFYKGRHADEALTLFMR